MLHRPLVQAWVDAAVNGERWVANNGDYYASVELPLSKLLEVLDKQRENRLREQWKVNADKAFDTKE